MPQTGQLIKKRYLLLTVLGAGVQDQGAKQGRVLVRDLFWVADR